MIYTANIGGKDNKLKGVKTFDSYNRFKNNTLNAKIYKVLPHLFIDDEWSIWIDSNIQLKKTEKELIALADGHDVTVMKHFERDCLYQEAKECKRLKLDSATTIDAQVKRYQKEKFPEHLGLGRCNVIIRRNTERVKWSNERWWAEICRGSTRDQISFTYCFPDIHYLPSEGVFDNSLYFKSGHKKQRNEVQ